MRLHLIVALAGALAVHGTAGAKGHPFDGFYRGLAIFLESGCSGETFKISALVSEGEIYIGKMVGQIYADGRVDFTVGNAVENFHFTGQASGTQMRGYIDVSPDPTCGGRFELTQTTR